MTDTNEAPAVSITVVYELPRTIINGRAYYGKDTVPPINTGDIVWFPNIGDWALNINGGLYPVGKQLAFEVGAGDEVSVFRFE